MQFQLKHTNNRNYLDVLACVDPTMEGFAYNNFSFSLISIDEFISLVNHITKGCETEYLRIQLHLHSLHIPEDKLIIQEFIPSTNLSDWYDFSVMLHLYKSCDIYSCYRTTYRFDGNVLAFGGGLRITHSEHANFPDYVQPKYHLTNEEKLSFPSWYERYHPQIFGETNSVFEHVLRTYTDSFLLGKIGAEYIYLFTIFESHLVFSCKKIAHQIAHSMAVLLSEEESEREEIYSSLKRLYISRSKFVHEGKRIDPDDLFSLREFVRKLILKLVDLGYASINADFNSLKEKIISKDAESNLHAEI